MKNFLQQIMGIISAEIAQLGNLGMQTILYV